MKVSDFDFELDESLIAQTPILNRDESRLLVYDRKNDTITHTIFHNILDYFKKGDVLVLNNSKVIPARLYGIKEDTNAHIEVLLLKQTLLDTWEVLAKPAKRVKVGSKIVFKKDVLEAICLEEREEGIRILKLISKKNIYEALDEVGEMPTPPYIHEKLEDKNRYQTVYAKLEGSAAAPTAGLHFTKELLSELEKKGVIITYVTLHVGLGTFRPVNVTDIDKHVMHSEYYIIPTETKEIIEKAKLENRRVISCGTTSTRTLESAYDNGFKKLEGYTNIFIYPGYKFKVVDGLITNFHLPKSTLIMLVSALAGKDNIMKCYNEAIRLKYRFFSFGDAMFII